MSSFPLNGAPNGHPVSSVPNVVRKKLMGYVGFANLPNQVHRKSVRKGFQFTAMVVGATLSPLFFFCPHRPAQASRGWANPRSLTLFSTPHFTPPRSPCLPVRRAQKLSQSKV
jgi:hypothetical protein